jgi:hypothetical protein
MTEPFSPVRKLGRGAGSLVGHVAAALFGGVLILIGSGMGVSLVLLPIGIPVGLIGLGFLFWGLFGWETDRGEGSSMKP